MRLDALFPSLIKPRTLHVLECLLSARNPIAVKQPAEQYGVQIRTIRYDLHHLDMLCQHIGISLRNRRGVQIVGPKENVAILQKYVVEARMVHSQGDPPLASTV